METIATSPARRLERLEAYLREDPTNPQLLADACDEAIAAGEHARAAAHLRVAEELELDALQWRLLRSRLAMGRRDWPEALKELAAVQELAGEQPAIGHDVAFVRFRMQDYGGCRSAVAPWLRVFRDAELEPDLRDALQSLWLRACHHLGALQEAWDWVEQQREARVLRPVAAGVASLIAVDRADFAAARTLADLALNAGVRQTEPLVARASVLLAEQKPAEAECLLRQALALNEADGRTWSALGMAKLQSLDPGAARVHFERAAHLMPRHIGTWHGLAWACLLQQDLASAEAAFQQALQLDHNFAESHGGLGLVRLLSGEAEEAERHLAVADRLDRKNVTGRYARALQQGQVRDQQALQALAVRLLDRPGFFGGRLSDTVPTVKK